MAAGGLIKLKKEKLRIVDGKTEKLCPHCNKWKDREKDFSPKRGSRKYNKVRSWCKECCVNDVAEWRIKNGRWRTYLTGRIQRIVANIIHMKGEIRSKEIKEIYKKQNGMCYYTGIKMKLMSNTKLDPLIMSADRINPSKGYTLENTVLCCLGMNRLKGRLSVQETYDILKIFYDGACNIGAYNKK